ncbi:MAG TPA: hypothetical protein VGH38_19565 [Bryobacteraceae bacterium]|jgi:DUF4097 and DUF4098 domain-containing protein YvlB
MHRSALFSTLAALAFLAPSGAQQGLTRENGRWVRRIYGSSPARQRLRVNAHGPVTLESGVSKDLSYVVTVSVNARSEGEARRLLQQFTVRLETQGQWTVLTAPGGPAMASVELKTPSLSHAVVSTSEGAVQARGVEGPLEVDSGAGELTADRIQGDCRLVTGGGDIRVGQVGGSLRCTTGAGHISMKSAGGEAELETNGGDIVAGQAGGQVRASTVGGGIHIGSAGGAVLATSGGGEIVVEKADGIVTVRNMAGPVQIRSAAGVRCESGSGGIRVSNISGPMRVSTSVGSILANLFGSKLSESYLATGNGDITVLIPSNLGVTIQAQNNMADTLRRILSDFREVQARRQGGRVVAEGAVNGGGPLLQISGMGGTIFIRRQQ